MLGILKKRPLLCCALLLCSNALIAKQAQPENIEQKEEIVVIGLRTESLLHDLPGSVTQVKQENLAFIRPVHIQEALVQVPGVNYHRGNGQESLPSIRSAVLTGAGACGSILVLEENIPVRGAGSCNVNELFDTHFEHASSIEVVRGAGTAFYGSNSLTGSINTHLSSQAFNRASLEIGPHGYRRAKLAYNYINDDTNTGSVYFSHADDDGYRADSGFKQAKFSWRHAIDLAQWKLKLGATWTDLDQETAGFITGEDSYRDPALRRTNPNPEAFRDTRSTRAWLQAERSISNAMQVNSTVYVRDTKMRFLQHFLPGDPLEENAQTGLGLQSSLRIQGSDKLRWYVGIDAEYNAASLRQTQDAPIQGSKFLRATIPVGVHYDYEVDSVQAAVFSHMNWSVSDKWRVIAGARYEQIRYDYDNLALDGRTRDDGTACGFGGCRYSRPADSRDDFSHFSPNVEIQYRASDSWMWAFAVSDAYRAPQATELYRLQRAQTRADLDEVSARSAEARLRWKSGHNVFSASAYYQVLDNVIIRDADFFNINGQKIDSKGLELEWAYRFAQQSDTRFWTLNVAATIAEHEYASEQILSDVNILGNEVDTAPNSFANALLTWNIAKNLASQLEVQHIGEYYTDPENAHRYPGHTVLNWSIKGALQTWGWRARVTNLTNRLYAERADFTRFTQERFFPGESRAVYFELSKSF